MWTLHLLDGDLYLLRDLDLLTSVHIIFVLDIDIVVGTSDAPAHASKDLVKGLNVESRSIISCSNQEILDLLQELSLKHLCLDDCALSDTPSFHTCFVKHI